MNLWPPPIFFLFPLVFLVIGAVMRYRNRLFQRSRETAMAAFARSRGWSYIEDDITAYYGYQGPPFEQGREVRATNVLRGEHNRWKFTTFDYRFTVHQGRSEVTHVCSVLAVQTGAWLTRLWVTPETFGSMILDHITGHDIDTESEEFNKTFKVRCDDRKLAIDVLNPRMMQYLLQLPHLGWSLQSGALVIATAGLNDGQRIDYNLTVAEQILGLVPGFVWTEAGVSPPTEQ
ncbi:MAG: hypothetical protein JWR52_2914 [Marmoricola sp.]|nr:hypothetical protein [Marmoricola sp.]